MKSVVFFCAALSVMLFLTLGGCVSKAEFDRCVRRNQIQLEHIQALESVEEAERLRADKDKQEYDLVKQKQNLWHQKTNALQAQINAKQALIDQLTEQLGQIALPPELSSALTDWAHQVGSDLVSYDEKTGIVRFKSDLLFAKGDDAIQAEVQPNLEEMAAILRSDAALDFDVLIVGHTDDLPILQPATLARHPTNWHLSAHRAIAVENILAAAGITEARLAVIGMGEHRPIEPNKPDKKGNSKNRRVEIYIVPAGQVHIADVPEPSLSD